MVKNIYSDPEELESDLKLKEVDILLILDIMEQVS